ncbi:MAG: hypothetical protein KAX11_05800 [Candidatus Aminicenantes bacterium]|nr:hypothetical protein [Candidatus Aminicenantes bacterium]
MKKCFSVLVLLFFVSTSLSASEEVELFGYFETQGMGAVLKGDFLALYTNKLRVDLKAELSDNITFAANFDYITYHGKTEWNILDFLADNITSQIPDYLKPIYVIPFTNRHFLDNAYIKLSFKLFDLTVGKQQISLGTGYVWNPTDMFNIKDPLDPSYEQPGHNAIRLDVPLSNSYTLTALFSPDDTLDHSGKLIQLKGRISHFDFTLIAAEKAWTIHDYYHFNLTTYNFLEKIKKRQLVGGSLAGELLGVGVWAEYAYNNIESGSDYYEMVVGADYTFDFQTYIMVEFYRNTLGKTDYLTYDLNDWMRMFTQEQKAISRDQIYVFIQHPVTDLMNLGISTIYSISDSSFALVPTLNYSLSDNTEIMAYFNINFGGEGKVFDKNAGSGGLIRLRVYF